MCRDSVLELSIIVLPLCKFEIGAVVHEELCVWLEASEIRALGSKVQQMICGSLVLLQPL